MWIKLKGYCLESKDGIIQSLRDDRISQRASQINEFVLRFKETNIYFNGSYYVVVRVDYGLHFIYSNNTFSISRFVSKVRCSEHSQYPAV